MGLINEKKRKLEKEGAIMIAIYKWSELTELEGKVEEHLLEELKSFYIEVMTVFLCYTDYINNNMAGVGKIAIFEKDDNVNNLPAIGLTEDTLTMLEYIPEFIDEITIADEVWYRCTIIFGAFGGGVVYVPESLAKGKLGEWINENIE